MGGFALSILFVAAIVGLLIYFDTQEQVLRFLNWLDTQGVWVLLLFTLVMALVVVLLLPGVMFTTGAGFIFGVVKGSICVVLGTTMGATPSLPDCALSVRCQSHAVCACSYQAEADQR